MSKVELLLLQLADNMRSVRVDHVERVYTILGLGMYTCDVGRVNWFK